MMKNNWCLFLLLLMSSCSAAHRANVREKIANEYHTTASELSNPSTHTTAEQTKKKNKYTERSKDAITAYIEQYQEIAKETMRTHKIPASITLAQGILESGIGKGPLAQQAHNHFGIKCKNDWTGESTFHTDDQPDECFRKYDSAEDSYRDHADFLTTRSHYQPLFSLDILDYKGWAEGLRKAGYASDRKYPEKLIGLIERYHLNEIDEEVVGENIRSKQKNGMAVLSKKEEIISNKNLQFYRVESGDTLYGISRKTGVPIDTIKEKNKLESTTLQAGQLLQL